jgi:hypothetical protein
MAKDQLRDIVQQFGDEMERKGVPFYVVGIVSGKDKMPVIEIVVKRPDRYNAPKIISKIPSRYKGLKVLVV